MRISFIYLFLLILVGCKPGQETVDFGKSIYVAAGISSVTSTPEDTPTWITYTYEFAEDSIDLKVKQNLSPRNGKLSNCAEAVVGIIKCLYTPKSNFFGDDRVGFIKYDGDYYAPNADIVSIKVSPVNDKPEATRDTIKSTLVNKMITFKIRSGIDIDSPQNSLVYELVDSDAVDNGELTNCFGGAGVRDCTYTPNLDFVGSDSFLVRVKDDFGEYADEYMKVIINVTDNLPPVMPEDVVFKLKQKTELAFELDLSVDPDGNSSNIKYEVLADKKIDGAISSDCLKINNGKLSCKYIPTPNYFGVDNYFDYIAIDEDGFKSAPTRVSFNVTKIMSVKLLVEGLKASGLNVQNDTTGVSVKVVQDGFYNFHYDVEMGQKFKYRVVSQPVYHRCLLEVEEIVIDQEETIVFVICELLGTAPVDPVYNLPPVIGENAEYTLDGVKPIYIQVYAARDPDGDDKTITYKITKYPEQGEVSSCFDRQVLPYITCKFTSNEGFAGLDYLEYEAYDSMGLVSVKRGLVSFKEAPKLTVYTQVYGLVNASLDIYENTTKVDKKFMNVGKYEFYSNLQAGTALSFSVKGQPNNYACVITNPNFVITKEMNTVNIACVKAETPPPTIKYSPTVGADQNFVILKDALKEFSVNAANDPDGDNSKIMYQVKSVTNGSVDPSCFIQIDRTACTFKPDPLNPAAVGVIEYVAIDTEGYSSETATDVSKRVAKVVFEVTQEYSLKVLILGEIGYGELELIEDRTYKKEIYTTAGEYVFCSGIAAGTPVKMKIGRTPLYHVCKIENPEIILTEEMNTVVVNCYEDLSLNEAPVVGPDIERTAYVGQQIKFNILKAHDPDGDDALITYKILSVSGGSVDGNCLKDEKEITLCTFTPPAGVAGTYTMKYEAIDGYSKKSESQGTVTFNIAQSCVLQKRLAIFLDKNFNDVADASEIMGDVGAFTGNITTEKNYDYRSASYHPKFGPKPSGFEGNAFFYNGTDGLSFNMFFNIDAGGSAYNAVRWDVYVKGNLSADTVMISDDHPELKFKSTVDDYRKYEGNWRYWNNTDGGAIGPILGEDYEIKVKMVAKGDIQKIFFHSVGGDNVNLTTGGYTTFFIKYHNSKVCLGK